MVEITVDKFLVGNCGEFENLFILLPLKNNIRLVCQHLLENTKQKQM